MTEHITTDPFMRACLAHLMHELASDRATLKQLTGQLWLTYPKGRRLVPRSISGNFPQIFVAGKTFPEALLCLADMLSTPHGHVLCHSMIEPGFDGAITIGHSVHWDQDSRSLTRPRATLVGIITRLDTRQDLLLTMDIGSKVAVEPDSHDGLETVVANTWMVAETIDNMARAPLSADALQLAQEILDVEPAVMLGPGRRITASGSNVAGSNTRNLAQHFLSKVAAASRPDDTAVPARERARGKSGTIVVGDMKDLDVYATVNPDPAQPTSARTYRAID